MSDPQLRQFMSDLYVSFCMADPKLSCFHIRSKTLSFCTLDLKLIWIRNLSSPCASDSEAFREISHITSNLKLGTFFGSITPYYENFWIMVLALPILYRGR